MKYNILKIDAIAFDHCNCMWKYDIFLSLCRYNNQSSSSEWSELVNLLSQTKIHTSFNNNVTADITKLVINVNFLIFIVRVVTLTRIHFRNSHSFKVVMLNYFYLRDFECIAKIFNAFYCNKISTHVTMNCL